MPLENQTEHTEKVTSDSLNWIGLIIRSVIVVAVLTFGLRIIFPGGAILETGQLAPPVYLESYDGKPWDISLLKEKPVLVNFWATWCTPCLQEIPHLVEAAETYRDDVTIVGFTVDSPAQDVFEMIRRFGMNYPVAKVDFATVERWGARTLPSTFLLDAQQKIIWSARGTLTKSDLDEVLGELLPASQARVR